MKILKNIGIKSLGVYSEKVYRDDFYYKTYDRKILLKILKDKLPVISFNF